MKDYDLIKLIARAINQAGGRAFLVGGSIRDELLKRGVHDFDIEVYNLKAEQLVKILEEFGTVLKVGKSFGIYILAKHNIDVALPRREKKSGLSHRDFVIEEDPYLDYKDAAIRRDFTINALMKDILTGEVYDYFGGLEDLNRGLIRHIDAKRFVEDPLRVLRAARFKVVLGFEIDQVTIELCRQIDISSLSKSRIKEEIDKVLIDYDFYEYLQTLEQMDKLDELFGGLKLNDELKRKLTDVRRIITRVDFKLAFMYAILASDYVDVASFLNRFIEEKSILDYVKTFKQYQKEFIEALEVEDHRKLILLLDKLKYADDFINYIKLLGNADDKNLLLDEVHKAYLEFKSKPKLDGNDILKLGVKDGKQIKAMLEEARVLALDYDKAEVIKQLEEKWHNLKK